MLAVVASACETVEVQPEQMGYLYIDLQQDFTVDPVFKSEAAEDMTFSLTIYDWNDQVVATYDDHRELAAQPLELRAAPYRVTATSAPTGSAAFDAPFYSGETQVVVKGNALTSATLTVSLANVKVTTSFSQEMKGLFSEYTLTVTNGEGSLTWSNLDGSLDREGYFSANGTLTWTLSLKNIEGSVYEDITETYTDVKPRQHYNLQFSLGEVSEFGGASVECVLDDSTKDKTYNLLLDFEAHIRPTVSSFGFDMFQSTTFAEGDNIDGLFRLNVPGGFKSAKLTHSSIGLSNASLPYNFNIMNKSEGDRAYYQERGIIVPYIQNGDTEAYVDLSAMFAKLSLGTYQIDFIIESNNGKNRTQYCRFEVVSAAAVEAVSATAWANFAFLKAKWYPETRPEGVSFQYRKQASADWVDVDASLIETDDKAKVYTAEVWGLDGNTPYVFRAVSSEETQTKEKSFTTESAGVIPNMGFDLWYKNGSIWYPNENSSNFYWDTANGGSDAVGVYPTSPEYDHKKGGASAAKLESKSVALVGLAAGNIYTGKFVKAITSLNNPGAELDWGVQFTSRPLALKGYVDYRPGTVNKTNAPYTGMSGKADIGIIQAFITDWSSPFRISTASGKFVNTDTDSGIIAHGAIDVNQTSGYIEFVIPLTYRSTTRIPRYLVIAASASKYGDYFTGSTSSVMYVDEFEFIYDPAELTEDQRVKVKYK